MIVKSYDFNKLKKNWKKLYLFYGNNNGYKSEIIEEVFIKNYSGEIIRKDESDVIIDQENFITGLVNKSLFEEKKLILISRSSDKIYEIIKEINEKNIDDIIIILDSGPLDKKSKLRSYFEKEKDIIIVPFYEDSEKVLISIAREFIRNKKIKISQEAINLIVERCQGNRGNLKTELTKLLYLSQNNTVININQVSELTNIVENFSVFELVDNYLMKNKIRVSKILNENIYNSDDCILLLRTLLGRSKRLIKLKEITKNDQNIDYVLTNFKPAIFWKDKENVKKQLNSWSLDELKSLNFKICDTEILAKKNFSNSMNIVSNLINNY